MTLKKHHMYSTISNLLFEESTLDSKINILDYGCGSGVVLEYLPSNKIKNYIGVDINDNSIKVAKQKFKNNLNFSFVTIDKSNNFSIQHKHQKFDSIISIGVLQYLNEIQIKSFLKTSESLLKPGGSLIICTNTDHIMYKILNIYQYFLPHFFMNREKLVKLLKDNGFEITKINEKGLFFTPFFSNFLVFFFDSIDKLVLNTKGELGFFGKSARSTAGKIIWLEYLLTLDFGSSLYIKSKKITNGKKAE